MSNAPAEYDFPKRQVFIGIVAIFAVYGTMAYLVQALSVARPKMAAELNGMPLYALAVSIPALVGAFATLIYGKLSDLYGRRRMLLIAVSFSLASTIMCASAPTFVFLIAATVIGAFGSGAMMPLVFAAIGDLFPPERRGKWIGLLNIPVGICALVGPILGGWFVDNLSWRYLYLIALPLLIVCIVSIPMGIPSIVNRQVKPKIDVLGCIVVAIAASTALTGLSFAGTRGWGSPHVLILLGISFVFWIIFLQVEGRVKDPVVDPSVLRNRSFLTVSVATLLSFLASMGLSMYFPMFLQGVQGVSTLQNSYIIIPNGFLTSFLGVPVGFLLSRSKRFKWMYVVGFGLMTADMFAMQFLSANTPIAWSFAVSAIAGIGMGAVPTINTLVVQNAVPKRLLGVAMGSFFFAFSMGMAIAPAILGSAMTSGYEKKLSTSLPKGLEQFADKKTLASLSDQKVLLNASARDALKKAFESKGEEGESLYRQTVQAIRDSMQSGLRAVFLVGAVGMLIAFLLICTIPKNAIGEGQDKAAPETVKAA
jgi:MFS family permease